MFQRPFAIVIDQVPVLMQNEVHKLQNNDTLEDVFSKENIYRSVVGASLKF
jgi:hypothetical protein